MKREFLINIIFLILINLLIKPFYIFFIDAKVQDTLGPEKYGLYFGIFNFAYILYILTDMGIQNYNSKTIAQNNNLLKEYLPNILGVKVILSLVFIIVGFLFALLLGYDKVALQIYLFVAVNLILVSFILYLRTNISAMGNYRWDSIISVLDKVILIVVLGLFLYYTAGNSFSLYHYIFSQTFAFFIVFVVVLIINFKMAKLSFIRFSPSFAKKILRRSLPFSLVFVLMTLYMKMDGFMLERMLSTPVEAGIYAAAFRLYEAFNNIGYLFAVLLLPMYASLIGQREKLKNLVIVSHNIMIVIAMTAVLIAIFYNQDIMRFLYPATYSDYYGEILTVLMISFFAINMTYIYGTILTAAGKISVFNKIVTAGVIINLVLNLILIPRKGALGAAISTVFTQYFVLGMQYFVSKRNFDLGFDKKLFGKRLLFVLLLMLATYVIKNYIHVNSFEQIVISIIISLVLAIFTGMVKLSDLKQ